MSSLKKLATRGAIWTILGYGSSQLLRLGSNIILTRLLVPEFFGLMALVNTFIIGLNLFSDLGIEPSIIRSQRWREPILLNTAWTLQVIRGWVLWLASIAIAFPVAQFYKDSRLFWIIPIVGLTTAINGFTSTSLAVLRRELQLGKLIRFDLVTQIISLVILIVWSYLTKSIWALIGGSLIGSLIKTFWSHRLVPEIDNNFAWNRESLSEIVAFGRWVFISTLMYFLASQSDRLILGKLFSLSMLGVYIIAFTLSEIPRAIIQNLSQQIIFPLISQRIHLSREELKKKILKKRELLLIISACLVAVLMSFGDLLILSLYDERYAQAAWMFFFLAMGIWPATLTEPMARCLNALDRPYYLAIGNCLRFLFIIILMPYGFNKLGELGAIIIVALNDLPTYTVINYGLWREKLICINQDVRATGIFIFFTVLFLFIRLSLGIELPFSRIITNPF